MNEEQARKWSHTRRKGPGRFVALHYALPASFILTALVTLLEFVGNGELIPIWLPIRIIVFGFVGFFIGMFQFQSKDKKYLEAAPGFGLPIAFETKHSR
ncbi:hypothetical protein [Paenibacillus sp. FJAT-26967]|uniref:hypothetical protein n=1 Tax=Paenibacillus sp. FJAT-26967 TaxID=1729690 RepID=UPI000838C451|nr:hypothetical protein [Paenibacillus sp. FJAT-26967]